MQSPNALTANPALQQTQSCGVPGASQSWLSRNKMIAFGLAGVLGLIAFGLSQNWLTLAGLLPFLYVLPCAAMMFMCMKGMNHGPQTGSGSAGSPTSDKQVSTDA